MKILTNLDLNKNEILNAVLQPLAAAPSNPREGQLYYNSVDKVICYYNGTRWSIAGEVSGTIQTSGISSITINGEAVEIVDGVAKLEIPTKLSEFDNDEEFIKSTADNLVNYYKRTETYSQEQVNELIGQIKTVSMLIVDTLPTEDIATNIIYLVPKAEAEEQDVYDEFIYIESLSKWELIGSTKVNLSNYLQKDGDASTTTIQFSVAEERSLPITGETLAVIISKVVKYFTDLKDVAFTGSYKDLSDKPIETSYVTSTLTAGETSKTITIPEGCTFAAVVVHDNTGAQVLTDVESQGSTVTILISEALAFDLSILVTYFK